MPITAKVLEAREGQVVHSKQRLTSSCQVATDTAFFRPTTRRSLSIVCYTPTHTHLHTHTPAHTPTHLHIPTHLHTYTPTHLHTYTPTHTYTHTRTAASPFSLCIWLIVVRYFQFLKMFLLNLVFGKIYELHLLYIVQIVIYITNVF